MIIRARWIVTMDGPPIENGAVAVKGAKIVDVGRWLDVQRTASADVIDLGESILLPGLINAHCHLDYTLLRGAILRQTSFTDWIRAINAQKASLTATDYLRSIANGFAEAAEFGTTTIANLEAFPDLLAQMPTPPLRTWWFAEMIDVRAPVSPAGVLARMQRGFNHPTGWLGGLGFAPHSPFTASRELYREAARVGAREGLPLTTHLAESSEEMQMFRDGAGPLYELMRSISPVAAKCGSTTPLGLVLDDSSIDERWIIAHLNELTTEDLRRLRDAPKFHIVHCPRSHACFGHSRFRLQELRSLGFNICLGTDSLASNHDLSLFAEMRQMAATEPGLAPAEILGMATSNGAAALGQAGRLGQIREGAFADLAAVPCHSSKKDVFEQILAYEGKAPWHLVNGNFAAVR